MHVLSRRKLREFWADHPDAEEQLAQWFKTASRAEWRKFADVRAVYGSVDQVEKFLAFNICGNRYRLIVDIYYDDQLILVRHVLPHQEYDQGRWKVRPTASARPSKGPGDGE